MQQAEELKRVNLPLALRILQRVRNLKPSKKILVEISRVSNELKKTEPDIMSSSSNETDYEPNANSDSGFTKQSVQNPIRLKKWFATPFSVFVLIPFLLFFIYQALIASARYESHAQIIIQQPNGMSTLDPKLALLSGFSGGSAVGQDTQLLKAFIYSNDLLQYLNENYNWKKHFSDTNYDVVSRLSSDASAEDQLDYFKSHVTIEIDEKSSVFTIRTQAYEPKYANELAKAIVNRAEWYINKIGHDLAKAQLTFVQNEHEIVIDKLQRAKSELLAFQSKYNFLDPEAEGAALAQITYGLESQIATKKSELRALKSSMSEQAPAVMLANEQLKALETQLEHERERLTDISPSEQTSSEKSDISVNEVIAKFSEYKMNLQFALEAYTASQVSLEKSRIEAYRQLKYLVVVENPTVPEDASYPEILYNCALFIVLLSMLFGVIRIVLATIEELK
ncbi:lipopolysaccharide biosynthesis protein [Neptunicella marina]|uniref:Lipopolysaccharide biosynthesis protein n=1 Tax=Neptunicella marina TaxID=2125989 RepID=A0A8J6IRH8_9ALTE|nr:lipopolysaccharide biosynthesis protein [Neptunicella marina]